MPIRKKESLPKDWTFAQYFGFIHIHGEGEGEEDYLGSTSRRIDLYRYQITESTIINMIIASAENNIMGVGFRTLSTNGTN